MELEAEWPREPYAESLTKWLDVSDLSTCSALWPHFFFFSPILGLTPSSMPLLCSSIITVVKLLKNSHCCFHSCYAFVDLIILKENEVGDVRWSVVTHVLREKLALFKY